MSKYTPATFQPVIRPDWGGVMSYLPVEEKAQILEALIKYPSVECESRFWLETIKPDLDIQYNTFIRQCEAKSRAVRDRWAKTSITPLEDMNKTSNRGGIVSESERERECEKEKECERGIVKGGKFSKPTLEDVRGYCLERNNQVDPERWFDYYTSNGWKIGKNSMKDWRAAVRTWEKSSFASSGSKTQSDEEFYRKLEEL